MVLKIWHCFLALQAFQLKPVLSASRQPSPPPNQNSAAFGAVFTSSHCFKVEQSHYSEKNGKLMQHAHRKVEKKVDEQNFLANLRIWVAGVGVVGREVVVKAEMQ